MVPEKSALVKTLPPESSIRRSCQVLFFFFIVVLGEDTLFAKFLG
jgi:hypothetical protein